MVESEGNLFLYQVDGKGSDWSRTHWLIPSEGCMRQRGPPGPEYAPLQKVTIILSVERVPVPTPINASLWFQEGQRRVWRVQESTA